MSRNRLIDGWRGVSVTLVILGHMVQHRFGDIFVQTPFRTFITEGLHAGNAGAFISNMLARVLAPIPALGVDIFFITSGFLITSLLMKEEKENAGVSLKAFYARRAFRILPAFFAYLLAVYALWQAGFVSVPVVDFAKSALFLCSLPDANCAWWVGHSWSLSVEEQFYVVFPLAFLALKRWRTGALLGALAVLTAAYAPYPRSLSFAHIVLGALVATSPAVMDMIVRLARPRLIALSALVLVAQPFLDSAPLAAPVLAAVRPLMIAVIFFGTLNGAGPFVRIVSLPAFHKIGLASYSLYLWQQLSTADPALYGTFALGLNPLLFIAPALASYLLLEKPMVRLGRRVSVSLTKPPAALAVGASAPGAP